MIVIFKKLIILVLLALGVYGIYTYSTTSVGVNVSGKLDITESGIYDVSDKEYVNVDIAKPDGTLNLSSNGTYDVVDYAEVNIQVKEENIIDVEELPTASININCYYRYNNNLYCYMDNQFKKVLFEEDLKQDFIKEVDVLPEVGYKGTAIPTSGNLETMYFNGNMSTEETDKILSQLDYIPTVDGDMYVIANCVDENNETLKLFVVIKVSTELGDMYIIGDFYSYTFAYLNEIGAMMFGIESGWILDKEIEFDGNILPTCPSAYNLNSNLSSEFNAGEDGEQLIVSVGLQNEIISSIVSSTPFEKFGEIDETILYKTDVWTNNGTPITSFVNDAYINLEIDNDYAYELLSSITVPPILSDRGLIILNPFSILACYYGGSNGLTEDAYILTIALNENGDSIYYSTHTFKVSETLSYIKGWHVGETNDVFNLERIKFYISKDVELDFGLEYLNVTSKFISSTSFKKSKLFYFENEFKELLTKEDLPVEVIEESIPDYISVHLYTSGTFNYDMGKLLMENPTIGVHQIMDGASGNIHDNTYYTLQSKSSGSLIYKSNRYLNDNHVYYLEIIYNSSDDIYTYKRYEDIENVSSTLVIAADSWISVDGGCFYYEYVFNLTSGVNHPQYTKSFNVDYYLNNVVDNLYNLDYFNIAIGSKEYINYTSTTGYYDQIKIVFIAKEKPSNDLDLKLEINFNNV